MWSGVFGTEAAFRDERELSGREGGFGKDRKLRRGEFDGGGGGGKSGGGRGTTHGRHDSWRLDRQKGNEKGRNECDANYAMRCNEMKINNL